MSKDLNKVANQLNYMLLHKQAGNALADILYGDGLGASSERLSASVPTEEEMFAVNEDARKANILNYWVPGESGSRGARRLKYAGRGGKHTRSNMSAENGLLSIGTTLAPTGLLLASLANAMKYAVSLGDRSMAQNAVSVKKALVDTYSSSAYPETNMTRAWRADAEKGLAKAREELAEADKKVKEARPGAGTKLMLGLGLGTIAAQIAGSIAASITPTRTAEEQKAHDSKISNVLLSMLPGFNSYNRWKRVGRALADEKELNAIAGKNLLNRLKKQEA